MGRGRLCRPSRRLHSSRWDAPRLWTSILLVGRDAPAPVCKKCLPALDMRALWFAKRFIVFVITPVTAFFVARCHVHLFGGMAPVFGIRSQPRYVLTDGGEVS